MIFLKPPSEKSELLRIQRKYCFYVFDYNKIQISQLVSSLFSVKVDSVRILVQRVKKARRGRFTVTKRPQKRMAIVTLADGYSLPSIPAPVPNTSNEENTDA